MQKEFCSTSLKSSRGCLEFFGRRLTESAGRKGQVTKVSVPILWARATARHNVELAIGSVRSCFVLEIRYFGLMAGGS